MRPRRPLQPLPLSRRHRHRRNCSADGAGACGFGASTGLRVTAFGCGGKLPSITAAIATQAFTSLSATPQCYRRPPPPSPSGRSRERSSGRTLALHRLRTRSNILPCRWSVRLRLIRSVHAPPPLRCFFSSLTSAWPQAADIARRSSSTFAPRLLLRSPCHLAGTALGSAVMLGAAEGGRRWIQR